MNGPQNPVKRGIKPLWLYLIVTLALAMIMTVGRAYNTDDMAFPLRSALWIVVCGLIVSQVLVLNKWIYRAGSWFKRRWLSGLIAVLITTTLVTIELDLLKYTPLLPKQHDPFLEFFLFMLIPVSVIGILVLSLDSVLPADIRFDTSHAVQADALPFAANDKWPTSPIQWLHAQEHYLQIQAQDREYFVRGRMRDAVRRLPPSQGMQVHRSWWVASDAVARINKNGRDYQLTLHCGKVVPVARSRVPALRSGGWLTS